MERLPLSIFSEQEREFYDIFKGLIDQHGLTIKCNEVPAGGLAGKTISLDVEHDESGAFVCCGLYDYSTRTVYSVFDLPSLHRCNFHAISIVAHNGKGDLDLLRFWGVNVNDENLVHDTMLFGHIIDSSLRSYGLKDMSIRELGIEYPSYDAIVGKRTAKQKTPRRTLDQWPQEIVAMYNAMDVFVTWKLYEQQTGSKSASADKTFFRELFKPCSYVWSALENRGVCLNLAYLQGLKVDLEAQINPVVKDIKNELGDINLNSPKQLLEALHDKEIYPELKGKPSTDKNALARHRDKNIVSNLLRHSELETLLSGFVLPYLERGQEVVHPFFNQCGTRTGRPSCSNPNLLQIPKRTDNGKKVRRMFIPRPGMLLGDCDYGQIEPRVLAHLSKDSVLCGMFNEGTDFHEFTSQRMGIDRQRAKVLNLSVGYRATKFSVSRQLGGSLDEAQKEIDRWWAMFPGLKRWQEKLLFDARKSGFITTLFGRRIRVDGLEISNPWKREAAERQAINNIAQGSAAEIMQKAMINIHNSRILSSEFGLLIQVYDELVWESRYAKENDFIVVKELMETAMDLDVPLTVDGGIGPNWADIEEVV